MVYLAMLGYCDLPIDFNIACVRTHSAYVCTYVLHIVRTTCSWSFSVMTSHREWACPHRQSSLSLYNGGQCPGQPESGTTAHVRITNMKCDRIGAPSCCKRSPCFVSQHQHSEWTITRQRLTRITLHPDHEQCSNMVYHHEQCSNWMRAHDT